MTPYRIQCRLLCAVALVAAGACATLRAHHHPASPAQADTPPPATAQALASLTVTVTDLRNAHGDLIFGVFTHADGFPNIQSKSVYWEVRPVDAQTLTFTARLPPGRYAAGVLHDENRSGDMDKSTLGIPQEGYGVTNNPKPSLRKATFEEATFVLPAGGATMTISLQYF